MLLLITIATFLTIFILLFMLMSAYVPMQNQVVMRLKALDAVTADRTDIDEELSRPFVQRVVSPLTGGLAVSMGRFTPQAVRRMVDDKMAMAGGFGGMSTDSFLLLCGFLAITSPVIVGGLAAISGASPRKVASLAMIAMALGTALPFISLNAKIKARKGSIQKDLPDVLDLLTVSVEAGLAFDGALAKLSEKMKGALVEEFARALQEIRIGVPRRDALHSMGMRCDVPDLSLFTTALVQADQLGVSIGNVLRVQSAAIREKRRQQAQEKAMKAPVKMLLPLVAFIFPTIFIILLGPAVIQLMTNFLNK